MIIKKKTYVLFFLFCVCALIPSFSAALTLTPEFDSQYQIPKLVLPAVRGIFFEYLDVFVLIAALCVGAYCALKGRSRNGLYLLTIFSALYFGFYRKGCICPIGAIQNVTVSFFFSHYILSLIVILFFTLPLMFALFFGRVFCTAVCPLGALQELVIFKPVKLPALLRQVLSIIPYLYLGLAVLFAYTGSAFLICQYDPFIGFYRLSAPYGMVITGIIFLVVGMFIARPYCRFFCPYGVLLGIFSFFSKKHLAITPNACIQCRLCEDSCPSEVINKPTPSLSASQKRSNMRRLGFFIACVPFLLFIMGYGFAQTSDMLAGQNKTVKLAERIYQEESQKVNDTTLDSDAFRQKNVSIQQLYKDAVEIRKKFKSGAWLVGIFLGIVISLKIIVLMQQHSREDYEPDRFNCVSCGRCMEYCPVKSDSSTADLERLGMPNI